MNSILIPESLLHEKTYNADKYFNERFPSDYATMEANPNYSESGCGIAVTASDTENTLSIKDPADSSKELCKLTYSNSKLKFTYKKPVMVNNITMVGVGSTEKLNILDNNFDILHLNVVKKLGGSYNDLTVLPGSGHIISAFGVVTTTKPKYSTDGINWTSGNAATLSNFCYDADKSILVGINYTGSIYTSTDGINWALTTTTLTSSYRWTAICYGNGKYVAMAIDKTNNMRYSAYSTDLISWTENELDSGIPMEFYNIAYGNGIFIAVSTYNSKESIDGINWNNIAFKYSSNKYDVCYGNEKFIIAGTNYMLYVGKDQKYVLVETQFSNLSDAHLVAVCYGNSKYVCTGCNYDKDTSMYNNYFGYSYDGYKWYFVLMDQTDAYKIPKYICYFPEKDIYIATRYDGTISIISIPDAYAGGVCNTFAVEYSWSGSIPSSVTLPNPTSYTSGTTVTVDTKYTSDSIELPPVTVSYPTVPTNKCWITYYGNSKWIGVDISDNNSTVLTSTDGITWTQNSESLPIRAYSICYGSGKFVVFSSTQNYVYSTDGIIWTSNTLPNSNYYKSLCYGNDKFMALSTDATTVIYSTDGISWTSKATNLTISGSTYIAGCYGNDKFVFIGEGSNQAVYSTDGITWKTATLPSQSSWEGICYGNGKFVASAQTKDYCAYSTDGITWTNAKIERLTSESGEDSAWSCAYGSGLFVIGSYNCNVYWLSTDGINWTRHEFDSVDDWYYVQYGNGKFIIATDGGIHGKFACLTVPDTYYQFSGWNKSGTFNITSDTSITGSWSQKSKLSVTYSWTNAPTGMTSTVPVKVTGLMPNETVVVDSKYTNNTAYKDTTNKKYYKFSGWNKSGEFNITSNTSITGSWDNGTSVDESWKQATIGITSAAWNDICYGNGLFIAVAQQYAAYSSDGVTWTQVTIRTSSDAWTQVCYGDGKFVAISNTKYIAYTTDGAIWTTTFVNATGINSTSYFGVCYGNGKWVVIEYGNGITKYSTDLVSWTEGSLGAYYMWRWALFGLGKFIAMTSTSKIAYSTDGITWTIIDTPGYFTKMRCINDKFYSFDGTSKKNLIFYSTDAINWTSITLSSIAYMSDICYDGSKYIISCGYTSYNSDYFLYSTDGITWSQQTLSISKPWNACASNGSVTVIIGYNTNICMYSMSYPNLDYIN